MARIYFPDELTPLDVYLLDYAVEGDTVVFSMCYGGDLATAIKLADIIREKKLNTEARYIVASAGVLCYSAGIKRTAFADARFLLHEAIIPIYAETNVNETELRAEAEAMRQYNETIINRMSDYTGADKAIIERYMRADGGEGTWLNTEQAIDLGLITDLIEASNEALAIANLIIGGLKMQEEETKVEEQEFQPEEQVQKADAPITEEQKQDEPVSDAVTEILQKVSAGLEALNARLEALEKKQTEFATKVENELAKPRARIGVVDASIVDKKVEGKPSGKLVDHYKEQFEKLNK